MTPNFRRRLPAALLAAAIAFGPAIGSAQPVAKGQRIFIAGHSFNVFICQPLEALAAEAGLKEHTSLGVQMIGNSTPMQHWNQADEATNIAKVALRKGGVDVFTMSPNATMPEEGIDKFVQDRSWGHHASCTCKIGGDNDPDAVLDSKFRVRGVKGLRVVDASVFPRIPGFFVVMPIYMIAEKAADAILADAK